MTRMLAAALSLFLPSLSQAYAPLWDLDCGSNEQRIQIEIFHPSDIGSGTHDTKLSKAKAKLTVTLGREQYVYTQNIFVLDEGQGNFRLQAFTLNGGANMEVVEVANLYWEHEGNYLAGLVKKPVYESGGRTGLDLSHFETAIQTDSLPCKDNF